MEDSVKNGKLGNPVENGNIESKSEQADVSVETSQSGVSEIKDLDSLLKPLGGFGKFQLFNMACLSTIIILYSFTALGYVMTTAEIKHRCLISECEEANASYSGANNSWLPYAVDSTSGEFDSCRRHKPGNATFSAVTCSNDSFASETYECGEFVYETDEWTIGREDWGIHCSGDKYLLNLVGSLNNVGQVIGNLYVGYLQDRFGRKLVVTTLAVAVATIGIIKSFSVNYIMMVVFEVLEASAAISLFNGSFVLALEIVDPANRVLAATVISLIFPLGEMILGGIQYLTFDWRTTIRAGYPPFLLVVTFYWILPESVRWLLDNGHLDKAVAVLRKIAKMNGTHLPEDAVKNILKKEAEKSALAKAKEESLTTADRLKELWRSKVMRWRVLCVYINWATMTFLYFALTFNSVGISENKFLNFVLNALVEIPGILFAHFVVDRLGRKKTQMGCLILSGIACIVGAFVPEDLSWLKLVLFLLGKFATTASAYVSQVFTTELFPTFVRGTMMATGSFCGKLATILAPQVNLLEDVYKPLPLLLFGGISFIGVLSTSVLPETLHTRLPDTTEEAERIGQSKSDPKMQT